MLEGDPNEDKDPGLGANVDIHRSCRNGSYYRLSPSDHFEAGL